MPQYTDGLIDKFWNAYNVTLLDRFCDYWWYRVCILYSCRSLNKIKYMMSSVCLEKKLFITRLATVLNDKIYFAKKTHGSKICDHGFCHPMSTFCDVFLQGIKYIPMYFEILMKVQFILAISPWEFAKDILS